MKYLLVTQSFPESAKKSGFERTNKMKSSNRRWFPVIAILCASSVCLTGCKSSSWSQLPGMSYFTSNEKPEQAYYGQQETPSSDYNASTVDYSQRYGNNDSANAQNTYGQQYESTNVGNTNYLNSQPQQQVTGQPQQLYGLSLIHISEPTRPY